MKLPIATPCSNNPSNIIFFRPYLSVIPPAISVNTMSESGCNPKISIVIMILPFNILST